MKVLMINGSPNVHGCTYTALCEIAGTLEKHGIDSEIYHVGTKPIAGCIACGKCKSGKPCIFDDGLNELAARLDEFDALIVGAPIYYAGPSGQSTAFLDRLFYSSAAKLSGKPAAAIVSCRRGGASAGYDRLLKYFSINSMPIVTSQYWNQVHGNTPEEVVKDEEGMQTMRTLGENMAWLLKCIEAGRGAGVAEPAKEPRLRTNFIR
ncbi:MAG: flavodoxin family protein [Ruminococcaceae bacterium]|nr:flavodoxin family protein [Oscillospiraceae bacterium]